MSDLKTDRAFCDLDSGKSELEPVVIVVFGASGDLAHRKVVPALYDLFAAGFLHPGSEVLGVARRPLSEEEFRQGLRESCAKRSHSPAADGAWEAFASRIGYLRGDLDEELTYVELARRLGAPGRAQNRLYYLAIGPDQFARVAEGLAKAGLGTAGRDEETPGPYSRLVVEKPFGTDRRSAHELNRVLTSSFAERDIFRIDHYLGKEAVQNLLYFRFANSIFEPLWNRRYVERIEIDVLETGGIGTRGGYYDRAGAARDMLQNHLVQLLCLAAMEPPPTLDPEAIRDEKVKVLRSVPDYSHAEFLIRSVRGQYEGGRGADGEVLDDYLAEAKVAPGSRTETFAALRLEVDNWRFAGVPFLLRTGKALDRTASEIRVRFRRPPETLFAGVCREALPPNGIVIRIQPEEGIWLEFNAKEPGRASLASNALRFSFRERSDEHLPEAYERLLSDALSGDATLFIRADEAEEAWRIVDGLETAWTSVGDDGGLVRYPAGVSPDWPALLPRKR